MAMSEQEAKNMLDDMINVNKRDPETLGITSHDMNKVARGYV